AEAQRIAVEHRLAVHGPLRGVRPHGGIGVLAELPDERRQVEPRLDLLRALRGGLGVTHRHAGLRGRHVGRLAELLDLRGALERLAHRIGVAGEPRVELVERQQRVAPRGP
ncbi:MAG: hypothetical protein ACK55I_12945, partial [bacterium]